MMMLLIGFESYLGFRSLSHFHCKRQIRRTRQTFLDVTISESCSYSGSGLSCGSTTGHSSGRTKKSPRMERSRNMSSLNEASACWAIVEPSLHVDGPPTDPSWKSPRDRLGRMSLGRGTAAARLANLPYSIRTRDCGVSVCRYVSYDQAEKSNSLLSVLPLGLRPIG